MLVSVREDRNDHSFDRRVNEALERVLSPAKSVFQEVFQVGSPRINAELKAILFDDLLLLGPLSAFILVVAILLFLRSGFAALVVLITSALSIATSARPRAMPLRAYSARSFIICSGGT